MINYVLYINIYKVYPLIEESEHPQRNLVA